MQNYYPLPNATGTNNGLQNNYEAQRFPEATRDNVDLKFKNSTPYGVMS